MNNDNTENEDYLIIQQQQQQQEQDKNSDDDTRSFTFDPPLFIQRKMFISNYLAEWYHYRDDHLSNEDENINFENDDENDELIRVIDVGCGNGNLLTYLREGITSHGMPFGVLDGVDKCETSLDEALNWHVRPMVHHHLQPLDHPLCMTLYHVDLVKNHVNGDDDDEKKRKKNDVHMDIGGYYHVSVCTEVIEHVFGGEELSALTRFLFHTLRSNVIIVTTPNRDFNPWFFGYDSDTTNPVNGGVNDDSKPVPSLMPTTNPANPYGQSYWMRHDDHKFEMTREEFERWAHDCINQYNNSKNSKNCGSRYELERISGVGTGIDGDLSLGYATQIAIFKRVDNDDKKKGCNDTMDKHVMMNQLWKVYGSYEYPVRQAVDPFLMLTCECTRICNQYETIRQQQQQQQEQAEQAEETMTSGDGDGDENDEDELEQLIVQGWVPVSHVLQQLKQRNTIRASVSTVVSMDEQNDGDGETTGIQQKKIRRRRRRREEKLLIDNEQELMQLLRDEYPYDYSFMEYDNDDDDANTTKDGAQQSSIRWFMRVEYNHSDDSEEDYNDYDDNDVIMDDTTYNNNDNNNDDNQWGDDTWPCESETSWTI